MATYYNDNDPFVCAWLRNLIAAKVIPAGEVDERPIQEVQPDDVRCFRQVHFFAGIGGWAYALQLAGWGVWTGSCPCQPFSAAGKRGSHADERHLWPEWFCLIRECRPQCVFGEQVSGAAGLGWLDAVALDLESEGYAVGACVLGAHSVGAPHLRQRLWFVADATRYARLRAERRSDAGDNPRRGRTTSELADAGRGSVQQRDGFDVGAAPSGAQGEARQRQRIRSDAGDGESVGGVADPLPAGRPEGRAGTGDGSVACGLDDTAGERRPQHERRARSGEESDTPSTSELGDTSGARPQGQREQAGAGEGHTTGRTSDPGELGHAPSERCGKAGDTIRQPAQRAGDTGAANFWSDCLWLPCRDGKARPVESGTFPLAHGVPARVGRLRAYGNAINPWTAAAFVSAYMETP